METPGIGAGNFRCQILAINSVLPGLPAQFRTATPQEVAQLPRIVDPQLLEGTTVNFSRSLIRLAWMLQHVETLLPMAGEIQAELNCHTAGVSDSHAWGLMLPFLRNLLRNPVEPDLALHQSCAFVEPCFQYRETRGKAPDRARSRQTSAEPPAASRNLLRSLLRNLLRNPVEPDLALHQSLP